jgi:hypothetical protein
MNLEYLKFRIKNVTDTEISVRQVSAIIKEAIMNSPNLSNTTNDNRADGSWVLHSTCKKLTWEDDNTVVYEWTREIKGEITPRHTYDELQSWVEESSENIELLEYYLNLNVS